MKIKILEILSESQNIQNLQTLKLPVKVSYRIKRLIDKLTPILKSYEEKRVELIKELGTENEETKEFNVSKENETEFYAKIKELQGVEEEIDFTPIKIEELGQIEIEPNKLVSFIFEE